MSGGGSLAPSRGEVAAALDAVRTRAAGGFDALADARGKDVVRWRSVEYGADAHRPDPWASERRGVDGRWDGPEPDLRAPHQRVGFDGDGRVAIVERFGLGSRRIEEAWLHGDGWSDLVTRKGVQRFLIETTGRVVAAVGIADDRPSLELWSWEDGVARRSEEVWLAAEHVTVVVCAAATAEDGSLRRLERGFSWTARDADDELDALEAGLAEVAELAPDEVAFDVRLHRREPRLRDRDVLVALLGPALERAVVEAVAACGVPRPFAVEVRRGREHAMPLVRVGGETFRDHVRATIGARHAALRLLADATPPDGATVSLVDLLDDEALRACRELDWALGDAELGRRFGHDVDFRLELDFRGGARGRASDALEALGVELSARLNGRDWPEAADPFLALVHLGALGAPIRPFVRAAQTVGKAHVQAFRRSLEATASEPPDPPPEAYEDRGALQAHLVACGLRADAARLAHEVAQVGLRLVPVEGGQVRSRLGGPGLLAPGAAWPRTGGDHPHAFLAGIDLAELPSTGELPTAGWLLFYADVDYRDDEDCLVDVSDNAPGAQIHVAYLAPGIEPVQADPPPGLLTVLRRSPVRAVKELTLPTGHEAIEELGLGPAERVAYDAAAWRLLYGSPNARREEERWWERDPNAIPPMFDEHWMLGWQTGVQGHMPEEDTVLLLHIAYDETLDFEYLDGGAIQFRIPRPALAAGDWSAVGAWADSS
jgi:hypothetical protein